MHTRAATTIICFMWRNAPIWHPSWAAAMKRPNGWQKPSPTWTDTSLPTDPSPKNSNGRNPGNTAFTLFRHGDIWCILQNAWATRTTVTGKHPPGLPFKKLWIISCLTAPTLKHGPGKAPGQTLRCPPSLNRSRRAGHNGNAPEPRPPLKASVFPAY